MGRAKSEMSAGVLASCAPAVVDETTAGIHWHSRRAMEHAECRGHTNSNTMLYVRLISYSWCGCSGHALRRERQFRLGNNSVATSRTSLERARLATE